mgnify:FL=1
MAELTSQAYSSGSGIFRTPGWMRVLVRDVNDPFDIRPAGVRGGIDIIDLANRYSCAFIQTQDIGRVFDDGSFEIEDVSTAATYAAATYWYSKHRGGFGIYAKTPRRGRPENPAVTRRSKKTETDKNPNKI